MDWVNVTSIPDRLDPSLPQSQVQRCHLLDTLPAPWLGSLFSILRGILSLIHRLRPQAEMSLDLLIVCMWSVDAIFGINDSPCVWVIVTFYSPEFLPTILIGRYFIFLGFSLGHKFSNSLVFRHLFGDDSYGLRWIFLTSSFSSHLTPSCHYHHRTLPRSLCSYAAGWVLVVIW